MRKSIIAAAALFAGAAIAAPVLGWSASDNEAQFAQAGPDRAGIGSDGMGDGMGMGRMGGPRGEHWGHHGWMRRMMGMSPQQRCEEHLARRAGAIAYIVSKLNLTAEQKPLWDKLQGTLQASADKERQLCTGLKSTADRSQTTMLDRINQREQFLSTRLQSIQQAKPAMEQLYQALSPEQKAIVDHPFRRL